MNLDFSVVNCFDLELCCWDNGTVGEIISIGVASLDLTTGAMTQSALYYVTPERDDISEFCTQLTGITPQIIRKQGRPLASVLGSVTKKFGAAKKLYTCWGLDQEMLARECSSKSIACPIIHCVNAAQLYMAKSRYRGPRLGMKAAMAREGLKFEGTAHNALVDSQNLLRLIAHAKLL